MEMTAPSAVLVGSAARRSSTTPGRKQALRTDIAGLSPALVLYGVFIIVPVLFAVFLSFTRWNVVSAIHWTGLSNWSRFFSDPVAHHALLLTIELAGLSWVVQTPLAMALGIFVAGTQRYRAVYAAIYLVPLLMSTAGIALMWQGIFEPTFGGLASLGRYLHLAFLNQNWLSSASLTFYVMVAIITWQFVPFHTLIYQAGRRAIPADLYDAAKVDGANIRQAFFHITLPQLRYTIVTSSTLILVGSLTYFDIIYILTPGGAGNITRVLALDMYDIGWNQQVFGYASVLAVVLGVIGIAVAVGLVRLTGFGSMTSIQEGMW
jgi:raffinose/stachyose/melibiose transport system permease protein